MSIPVFYQRKIDFNDESSLNKALKEVVKGIIYQIRSNFVHKASYFPFPDYPDKKEAKKRLLTYLKFKGGDPIEEWLILTSFERLHKIATNSFTRYWRKEYKQVIRNKQKS